MRPLVTAIGCIWIVAGLLIIFLRNRIFREVSRSELSAAWCRPVGLLLMGLTSLILGGAICVFAFESDFGSAS